MNINFHRRGSILKGFYVDNRENKKLGRVGQKYGRGGIEIDDKEYGHRRVVFNGQRHVVVEGNPGEEPKEHEIHLTSAERLEYQDLFKTARTIRPQYDQRFIALKEQDPALKAELQIYWKSYMPESKNKPIENLFKVNWIVERLKEELKKYDAAKDIYGLEGSFGYMYRKYAGAIRNLLGRTVNIQNKAKEVTKASLEADKFNQRRKNYKKDLEEEKRESYDSIASRSRKAYRTKMENIIKRQYDDDPKKAEEILLNMRRKWAEEDYQRKHPNSIYGE